MGNHEFDTRAFDLGLSLTGFPGGACGDAIDHATARARACFIVLDFFRFFGGGLGAGFGGCDADRPVIIIIIIIFFFICDVY